MIETLHQTEQRLEKLTGGEVDTVSNRAGQTLLLRNAQDQLRLNESVRQDAILNALPTNIALIDSQGKILSVNKAWAKISAASMQLIITRDIIWCQLPEGMRQARGKNAAEASQAAAGIRAVLAGKVSTYTLEYPCHSSEKPRWFLLTVGPWKAMPQRVRWSCIWTSPSASRQRCRFANWPSGSR